MIWVIMTVYLLNSITWNGESREGIHVINDASESEDPMSIVRREVRIARQKGERQD